MQAHASHDLPEPIHALTLTPMLGRQAEVDHLLALLTGGHRLVTIIGPGGVGKTRLATHLAELMETEFERDVVGVALTAVHDPGLVLPTLGQALEIDTTSPDGLLERIAAALRERESLIVLDNMEHVRDTAPEIAEILARAPEATMLVTSQAPLGIRGEQLFPLAPLPTPDNTLSATSDILQVSSVALFADRARAVNPSFKIDDTNARVIADICRRLDGLPLAIELAAARISILSPNALLARLANRLQVLGGGHRSMPERLRTMRHAIAWSYDLLTPAEQDLFRYLAVFSGGIPLEAVEAHAETGEPGMDDVYDLLAGLVDHSLLRAVPGSNGETRFLMLETLRDFGIEQLEHHGELDQARLAHATWAVSLAEEAEPAMTGIGQHAWMDRLDMEWDNIRAALGWTIERGHSRLALRILGAIWRFIAIRGHITEGRAFLDRALAWEPVAATPERIRGLIAAGYLAEDRRDLDASAARFREAQELAQEAHNPLLASQVEIGLGTVDHDRGEYASALEHHNAGLSLAREAGNQRAIAVALGNLATVSYFTGDYEAARMAWEETRQIMHAIGDVQSEALTTSSLGSLAMEVGDYERARALLTEAVALNRAANNRRDLSFALANLAEVWFKLGDLNLAESMFDESVSALREQGDSVIVAMITIIRARVAIARGDLSRAASQILESTATLQVAEDRFYLARCAEVMAAVSQRAGRHAEAVEFLAAAAALRAETGATVPPEDQADIDVVTAAIRAALPAAEYKRLTHSGGEMDLDTLCRRIMDSAREVIGTPPVAPVTTPPAPTEPDNPLTAREREVLRHLAEGASTREIGDVLFISPRTASTHVENILRKLGASSRAAAVAYALRNGLV
jgi:predicted ATPase/DNA-binding CsgD family transcriptional regulator